MSLDAAIPQMLETVLGTDTTLTGLAPGGVWNSAAPDPTTGVTVIFSFVSAPDDYTLKLRLETKFRYLVKAIAPIESSAGAYAAAARIDVLLNDQTPALADGRIFNMRRDGAHNQYEPVGSQSYQHVGAYYLIEATEN